MLLISKLEEITQWMQENVCNNMNLLKPSNDVVSEGYEVDYVHPTVFTMYIPTRDCLPPEIKIKTQAMCVQLADGQDDLIKNETSLNIRLAFATWNPGNYDSEGNLTKNAEGWKDVWRFIEQTKREIEKTVYIADMRVDRSIPIRYAPFREEESIISAWPYWYAFLTFTLQSGNAAAPVNSYQNLL